MSCSLLRKSAISWAQGSRVRGAVTAKPRLRGCCNESSKHSAFLKNCDVFKTIPPALRSLLITQGRLRFLKSL